jgi:hypothetical protein
MAATPRYGTATFMAGNQTLSKEIYVSDVDASRVNFDAGNGAGSGTPEYFVPSITCQLIDISLASGLADTHKLQMTVGGKATGDYFTYANQLNTLDRRCPIAVTCPAGIEVSFIQRSN